MKAQARPFIYGIALIVIGGVGIWLWSVSRHPPGDPTDAAQVARGSGIYAMHCSRCHGAELEGEPNWQQRKATGRLPAPPHDASGHTWHHSDVQLFGITKNGLGPYAPAGYQSDMPAFASALSDADIWSVLAFIKSRWPDDIRARQHELSAREQ
jgi:mono/diheme cytochrome c family protein